jgi:hypothetical protein
LDARQHSGHGETLAGETLFGRFMRTSLFAWQSM